LYRLPSRTLRACEARPQRSAAATPHPRVASMRSDICRGSSVRWSGQIRQLRALRDGRASPPWQCGESLLRLNPMTQYLVPFPSHSPPQPPRTGRAARRATSFTSRTPESEGDRHLRGRLAPSWRAWRALDRHLRGDCLNCRTLPASVSWWSRTRALRQEPRQCP